MLVGDFKSLFGTPDGKRLQQWCLDQKWVLAWALGAAGTAVLTPSEQEITQPGGASILCHTYLAPPTETTRKPN